MGRATGHVKAKKNSRRATAADQWVSLKLTPTEAVCGPKRAKAPRDEAVTPERPMSLFRAPIPAVASNNIAVAPSREFP